MSDNDIISIDLTEKDAEKGLKKLKKEVGSTSSSLDIIVEFSSKEELINQVDYSELTGIECRCLTDDTTMSNIILQEKDSHFHIFINARKSIKNDINMVSISTAFMNIRDFIDQLFVGEENKKVVNMVIKMNDTFNTSFVDSILARVLFFVFTDHINSKIIDSIHIGFMNGK